MHEFPDKARFKFEWRSYQQRVLDELDHHLEDNHLHIIAPPGSGKTILGLEVARRLNRPTLIFAPSLSIRNQWVDKFCQFFLETTEKPDWISTDIRNPGFLTIATYQALFSSFAGRPDTESSEEADEEIEEFEEEQNVATTERDIVIARLTEVGIKSIIVDEAHHLQNAWWKSLIAIKEALQPTIIGLTATPPYDSSAAEWNRYSALNGSVDAEISVPELVVEGDLCPHQDYIYFSAPTQEELIKIQEIRGKVNTLKEGLANDSEVLAWIQKLPVLARSEEYLDWIYSNTEGYSSFLIYLRHNGIEITDQQLDVLGNVGVQIPQLSDYWLCVAIQTLLNFEVDQIEFKEFQKKLSIKLMREGVMHYGKLEFSAQDRLVKQLSNSISKLDSINKIVEYEHEVFGAGLHMVILSDYIRKELLVSTAENTIPITRLGVIPIFEHLRRNQKKDVRLGVLTGSIVILHKDAWIRLQQKAKIHDLVVNANQLPYDSDYYEISISSRLREKIVLLVTELFEEAFIEVMVGTKSLLGEGWDAPSINSLILASFVGSFVLSNQMRGRAIRANRSKPGKTGNIWHLVCVDEEDPNKGNDFNTLNRRFKAFVGVSLDGDCYIGNGIERLGIDPEELDGSTIEKFNNHMLERASRREDIKSRWEIALSNGQELIEELEIPLESFYEIHSELDPGTSQRVRNKTYQQTKEFYWGKTLAYLYAQLVLFICSVGLGMLQGFAKASRTFKDNDDLVPLIVFTIITFFLVCSVQFFRYWRLYIKFRDINKDIHSIGEALVSSFCETELFTTPSDFIKVKTIVNEMGIVHCAIVGSNAYERSVFNSALFEIVDIVRNPKYVIIRKSKRALVIPQRDFHSVPEILARKKRIAQHFENNWNKHVGECELIYTRTIEGRKFLLSARGKSLAANFTENINIRSRWQ